MGIDDGRASSRCWRCHRETSYTLRARDVPIVKRCSNRAKARGVRETAQRGWVLLRIGQSTVLGRLSRMPAFE